MSYDLAVLGAGPGGYVAAIRAAQAGLKVALFDERKRPGGTCLNVGCIPSKTILHATEVGALHRKQAAQWQASGGGAAALDLAKISKTREQTIDQLGKGINFLFKKNKVTPFLGARAQLVAPDKVRAGAQEVQAKHIIIATGSTPAQVRGGFLQIDERDVLSSTGALALTKVPQKLLVVGGGVIGLEIASAFARLGSKVEVIEFLPHIGGLLDTAAATALKKILEKQGIKFHVGVGVTEYRKQGDQLTLVGRKTAAAGAAEQPPIEFAGDKILVAVGRKPLTDGLNLEAVGVKADKFGRVEVNDYLQTAQPNILAIGDCVPGPMLAHKAEEDACLAVANILGAKEKVDYSHIPGVVYTTPEVASVGLTEQEAKQKGLKYKVASFPMIANSRSKCHGAADGFVKIVADHNDKILGGTIISEHAGEIVTELVMAMKFGITAKQLGDLVHPHPTICEAVKEACMAVSGKAIHM